MYVYWRIGCKHKYLTLLSLIECIEWLKPKERRLSHFRSSSSVWRQLETSLFSREDQVLCAYTLDSNALRQLFLENAIFNMLYSISSGIHIEYKLDYVYTRPSMDKECNTMHSVPDRPIIPQSMHLRI